ncbi:membrane hypothetical protein [uncultured delta proteobacterium]|uniref:Uncharacterized protein n=1 Tax=uncultured delta proteobacterium TaxID=34034 RepID=A0A212IWJ7_9DELT|nr:membrane hypothetical protein [uncultured delta proteobacterium]
MRKIHCVAATFGSVRAGASVEKGLSRITADGKALFTQTADFTDPALVSRVPEGAAVFMGVQAFADGTFWMHWLHAPGIGTAEPPVSGDRAVFSLMLLAGGLAAGAGGGWLFISLVNTVLTIVGCLIAVVGAIAVFFAVHGLLVAANAKTRQLQRWLEAVKAGKTGMCVPLGTLTDFDPDDGGLADMLEDMEEGPEDADTALYQAEGPVSQVRAESITRGAGKYKQYFIEYTFVCAGRFVRLTIGEDTPLLHAIFRSNHPFMLAEGDRVRLIVGDDARTVKAMRNFEDGCAYWLVGAASRRKTVKAAKWLLLLAPPALPLLFLVMELLDGGRIDWGLIGFGAVIGVGVTALIMAILWLVYVFTRERAAYRADLPLIIEALELRPAKNKAKPYIHEL